MFCAMLYEFISANRAEILSLSREKLGSRKMPAATSAELAEGLPLFLDQIVTILRTEKGERGAGRGRVIAKGGQVLAASARQRGEELQRMGLSVGQVVHDYGSICQSVTELADKQGVAITAEEFQTFNRCLDDAIAEAVTTFESLREQGVGATQLGFLAHELRNLLTTATLTYEALAGGTVGIQGSTGTLHGRSLRRMQVLIDQTLSEVRLESGAPLRERVSVAELIEEIEVVATLEAKDSEMRLSVDAGSRDVVVEADHQILGSVIANLLQNAFKFSKPGGHITVRAHTSGARVLIEVEDQCGGLPPGNPEQLFRPFEQRGVNRTGLGLGLAISRKGIQASGGDIEVRDLPGSGCMFTINLPRAATTP